MPEFKIKFFKDKCIGCGNCTVVCSDNWEMKGEKSSPKKTKITSLGCNKKAAEGCPANAIEIFDSKGKKIA